MSFILTQYFRNNFVIKKSVFSDLYIFIKRGRRRMATSMDSDIKPQNYDYFLVLDFEATCDDQRKPHPIEIIEFPVLKINARTFECESTFHTCLLN